MFYTSTRSTQRVSAAEAIVNGISVDGGLYVPSSFPSLSLNDIKNLIPLSYPERVATILHLFMEEFEYFELLDYAERAYSRFDGCPAPVYKTKEGAYILELWHGPTSAFKDLALALLPYLITASRKKLGVEGKTLILVATSGDTGKAALEGFKDVVGTEIIVFYPDDGVSYLQKLQMITQEGKNVHVAAINGNFDDAQTAVKEVFADNKIAANLQNRGYTLSSANSINWGRLAPQIVYYISAYVDLVERKEIRLGDKIDFCVPSGNFGNILAGYYARKMGLPINNLICASNVNNVLTDFFNTGVYNANRKFIKTASPSMDILVSSNLERFLYDLSGQNSEYVSEKMFRLKEIGKYDVDISLLKKSGIIAGFADEAETAAAIGNFFEVNDYVLDPHTAVAMSVLSDYLVDSDVNIPAVVVSTASPYKFAADVYSDITGDYVSEPFKAIKKLATLTDMRPPVALTELKNKPVLHSKIVQKNDIGKAVLDFVDKD